MLIDSDWQLSQRESVTGSSVESNGTKMSWLSAAPSGTVSFGFSVGSTGAAVGSTGAAVGSWGAAVGSAGLRVGATGSGVLGAQAANTDPAPMAAMPLLAVWYFLTLPDDSREWVLGGSVIERAGGRVYNTSVLMDRRGRLVARYRKIHLFEARLESGEMIREQAAYSPGARPVMARMEGWTCGLSICYDLRFPELFRSYALSGCIAAVVPSAFTFTTGKDHWKLLVRARAAENQIYILAANRCGSNAKKVKFFGHSMIVDPWGKVLAECMKDDDDVIMADIDPNLALRLRAELPTLKKVCKSYEF